MKKKTKTKKRVTKKVTKKFLIRRKGSAPVLSEAAKHKLRNEAIRRQLPMVYKDLSLDEMSKVQQWTAMEGGFQRQLSAKQVDEVTAFMLYSPTPVIPPILLAKINGDRSLRRWCIDGQHRLKGAIQASIGIPAVVITVESLEQARYLFLIYNSKASKVSKKFIGMVSNNEVASLTRELSNEYETYYEHIKRLGVGLLGGKTTKYWDEVAHDAAIPAPFIKQMRTVLGLWTSDRRWTPDRFPEERPGEVTRCIARKIVGSCKSAYCVPGVLQVIGAVIRDLGASTTAQITTIVDVAKTTMRFKSTAFRRDAGLNGMETWCSEIERLKANVAKHALLASG